MRVSNATITVNQMMPVQKAVSNEELSEICEYKDAQIVTLKVKYLDETGVTISTSDFSISGENYTLLMSDQPEFSPQKPENEYREVDLWYMVDQLLSHAGDT